MSNFFENAQFVSEIPVKEKQELENRFNESGIDGCLKYVLERENAWKNIPLNIGVIGASGVGKSSFINAVRKLNADDEGAAAIGVYETTKVPTPYEHPSSPNLKLWDLPGVGTLNYPQSEYLQQIEFKRYDFFIVITASRFTEIDAWIAKCINEHGKQSYFVRSKLSVEIENDKKAHPKTHNATDFEAHIRLNLAHDLKHHGIIAQAFAIDSYKSDSFDFCNLENYLLEDYPHEKRQSLIKYVNQFIEGIILKKFAALRRKVKFFTLFSASLAAIPIPFASIVVIGMITYMTKRYLKDVGLDQRTLQGTSNFLLFGNENLRKVIHEEVPYAAAFAKMQLTADDIKMVTNPILNQKRKIIAYIITEEILHFALVSRPITIENLSYYCLPYESFFFLSFPFPTAPISFRLFAYPLSFAIVYYTLNKLLNELEKVSKKIVNGFVHKTINEY